MCLFRQQHKHFSNWIIKRDLSSYIKKFSRWFLAVAIWCHAQLRNSVDIFSFRLASVPKISSRTRSLELIDLWAIVLIDFCIPNENEFIIALTKCFAKIHLRNIRISGSPRKFLWRRKTVFDDFTFLFISFFWSSSTEMNEKMSISFSVSTMPMFG